MDNQESLSRLDEGRASNCVPYSDDERLSDPDKPKLPYRTGVRLSIRRHKPIPPFANQLYDTERPKRFKNDNKLVHSMTQSEWCLLRPPTASPPHSDPTVTGLEIIGKIACKTGRGPQLVRCKLDENPERILVAKIYDAFYYGLSYGASRDFTLCADHDYSREANAYEILQAANVDGKLCPKYYGSWTFDLPVPKALQLRAEPQFDSTRPVRMILYEWFEGNSIEELLEDEEEMDKFSPEIRLEMLAKGMEAFCDMEALGVRHKDFVPSNVLVPRASDLTGSHPPTVFIIDFDAAFLSALKSWIYDSQHTTRLPLSPRYRFFHIGLPEFSQWIPKEFNDDKNFRKWLATRWKEDDERFDPLTAEEKEYYISKDE